METTSIWQVLKPQPATFRRFRLFFKEPALRPPVLDEMMPDIERLISSVAARYSDNTTPHLQHDELVGDGRLKLAELITKGHIEKQFNRLNFFRLFKSCLTNQARSKVQKYRFTEKRTGVKPPPKHERLYASGKTEDDQHEQHGVLHEDYHKQVEISLDDEELNFQVPDKGYLAETMKDVQEDYEVFLTPLERMVLRQMVDANDAAYCHAYLDATYGRTCEMSLDVNVTDECRAAGLGLSVQVYKEAVLSIRNKVTYRRNMNEEQRSQYNVALAQLKQVFGLQIPPELNDMLIRRLLTLAARDQYTKVNEQVAELLESVGAKVPKVLANKSLQCFGVLFQANQRHCKACGLKESCRAEAENVGLEKIVIHPELLGARQTRIPVLLPTQDITAAVANLLDNPEIAEHLNQALERYPREGKLYYGVKDDNNQPVMLFAVESGQLRFCSPSTHLQTSLKKVGNGWYTQDSMETADILELMDIHVKEALDVKAS